LSRSLLVLLKIFCLSLSGVLTFAYSSLGLLAILSGLGSGPGINAAIVALWPLLAFPLFLLVFRSLRWAAFVMLLYWVGELGRCCGFSLIVWRSYLPESASDLALTVGVVSITLAYLISLVRGSLPPGQALGSNAA
jgi:hypothetical protein